jgi:hypothetical protein
VELGSLHPSLHYAGAEQIRLWQEVHRVHAPVSFLSFYCGFFGKLAGDSVFPGCFRLAALGAATAAKEKRLLEACRAQGKQATSGVACDIGPELALGAAEALEDGIAGPVRAVALAWEVASWRSVLPTAQDSGPPVVATAFGLLPNLLPGEAATALAEPLQPGDLLVASAHLAPPGAGGLPDLERIAPQYDNPETRAWLGRWLAEQGLERVYPEIVFSKILLQGIPAFAFDALRSEGENGGPERLRLFYSLRPPPDGVDAWAAGCGLETVRREIHPSGEEGLWCWRKVDGGRVRS